MNVIEFLLARYAEEEELARQFDWARPDQYEIDGMEPSPEYVTIYVSPAAVLADVEAKRAVVAAIEEHRENEWDGDPIHERVLYALASAYSTHPDYSQRWKP